MGQELQALIAPHDSQALLLELVKSTFQKRIPRISKLTKTFWLATTLAASQMTRLHFMHQNNN
ncbi:MAG: hypothetical protein AAF630_11735 [Cyanobacteria bacterium P01_C01_bin.38]